MIPPEFIDIRIAKIIKHDGYKWNGPNLEVKNPVYRLESGAIINEAEFNKLEALMYPQGVIFAEIYPPSDDE